MPDERDILSRKSRQSAVPEVRSPKNNSQPRHGAKQKGSHCWLPFNRIEKWLLDSLNVLGLPPFRAFNYVELDLLTFLEAAESARLNSREVYENVLAVLAADETITLGVVKPLYCSCFHGIA